MHLADTFIQSDLQGIQVIHVLSVCQYLGIELTTFCATNAMLYHWATGTRYIKKTAVVIVKLAFANILMALKSAIKLHGIIINKVK